VEIPGRRPKSGGSIRSGDVALDEKSYCSLCPWPSFPAASARPTCVEMFSPQPQHRQHEWRVNIISVRT